MIESEKRDAADFSDGSDILSEGELLRSDGTLAESGYAFNHAKRFSRSAIVKRRSRIKERDCYYFGDDKHAVVLSVSCYARSAAATVTVLDYVHIAKAAKRKTASRRAVTMPSSVESGSVEFDRGELRVSFAVDGGKRTLKCVCKDLVGKKDFECEIVLDGQGGSGITTAMPFEKDREFFYGTRINCFKGSGWYTLGNERVEFSREARGELEWSRGVYPHKCVWYRAGLSAEIGGAAFGLSLARNGSSASAGENAIFYNGIGSKIKHVKFEIPFTLGALDYLKPWKITDDEDRINIMFYPLIETAEKTRIGLGATRHKVFGKFYGKTTLDDGTIIDIADKIGYAEHTITRW